MGADKTVKAQPPGQCGPAVRNYARQLCSVGRSRLDWMPKLHDAYGGGTMSSCIFGRVLAPELSVATDRQLPSPLHCMLTSRSPETTSTSLPECMHHHREILRGRRLSGLHRVGTST
jgi:hypothetical protein